MAKKPATKNVPAKKEESLPATTDMSMFEDAAGAGMENTTSEDFAIPFLAVLQKMSPQVDEADGAYVEGAKAGMLYDNISGKLYDGKKGVLIVPCAYRRVYLRWAPEGFRGEVLPEDVAAMRAAGEIVDHKGTLLIPGKDGEMDPEECDTFKDARNHYVQVVDEDGNWTSALMSLGSTQIKKSKMLMSALAGIKFDGAKGKFTPPTFANMVRVTTVPESNDKGSWFGIKFEIVGKVETQDLFAASQAFYKSVAEGEVKAKYEESVAGEDDEKGGF